MNDDYDPARRPPGEIPGGERVTFERQGEHEQLLGGGSALDIEKSIMASTERNIQLIGWRIISVQDLVGSIGTGSTQEIEFQIQNGEQTKTVKITGIGLNVEIS